jgi:hypothetical protein
MVPKRGMSEVFISYARPDEAKARRVAEALRAARAAGVDCKPAAATAVTGRM